MVRIRTRDEILRVAGELFTRYGFKGTSLHDIAAEVGCSKATLLYHFAHKDAILLALLEPAKQALIDLVARLAGVDDKGVQEVAIDGFVELVLRYRREVALIYDVTPQFLQEPAFAAVRELTDALRAGFAGRSADPADHVAAEVLLGGIAAVVIDDKRVEAELRPALIAVARRALIPGKKD
ncbi:TetR/AcrR family transcriptional regulator [Asanoa sp. WMMD1127]|uniref:TetR/AcrR family transcriptional regulator n=1 Tax=Asanoa sp. WMMD1127 TaxID=3016107 RepID=UPI0024175C44|nr:TetR/AcrR family transcriptional regulator [Asanoa sp. WMMD1127]MDG4827318.1 TetR/AcrR family transcriptional regulator [Asanoa sp. WMMD1127]